MMSIRTEGTATEMSLPGTAAERSPTVCVVDPHLSALDPRGGTGEQGSASNAAWPQLEGPTCFPVVGSLSFYFRSHNKGKGGRALRHVLPGAVYYSQLLPIAAASRTPGWMEAVSKFLPFFNLLLLCRWNSTAARVGEREESAAPAHGEREGGCLIT